MCIISLPKQAATSLQEGILLFCVCMCSSFLYSSWSMVRALRACALRDALSAGAVGYLFVCQMLPYFGKIIMFCACLPVPLNML